MDEASNDFITSWLVDAINGAGGLRSFQEHEHPAMVHPDDVTVAIWIVRCLGNPRCGGSEEVLNAIARNRKEMDASLPTLEAAMEAGDERAS